jgi:hypothetical protein
MLYSVLPYSNPGKLRCRANFPDRLVARKGHCQILVPTIQILQIAATAIAGYTSLKLLVQTLRS